MLVDSSSKTEATDSRQGAGDYARINRGAGYNYAESGGVTLGRGSALTLAPNFSGGKIGGDVRITNAPPEFFTALTNLSERNSHDLTTLVEQQNESLNGTLGAVLGSIAGLAENTQTGGQASSNKTVLYIVLAALLAMVVIFGKD